MGRYHPTGLAIRWKSFLIKLIDPGRLMPFTERRSAKSLHSRDVYIDETSYEKIGCVLRRVHCLAWIRPSGAGESEKNQLIGLFLVESMQL
jgi:hypothetical protein